MEAMLATLKEVAGEEVANKMGELGLERTSDGVGTAQSDIKRKVEVYGKAYEDLEEFVQREEEKIVEMTHVAGSTVPTGERSFERDMEFASRVDSSTGKVELAWVRRDKKKVWETALGCRPAP